MPNNDFIIEYYQGIKDGTINVGEWVKLLYEYVVHGLEDNLFRFDKKKADKAINFIETQCRHSEGKLAPNLLKLALWQKALVSCIFGIVDPDGTRHFREVFVVIGRKNGKTLLASAIIAYMLYEDGEYGARGYCVAPKVAQADIVYNAFWRTVLLNNKLSPKTKHRKSDIYIEETNSSLQKIALSDRTSDGFNPHISVQDEIAAWTGDKGIKAYEVLKSGAGAREQPLMFSISTSGYVNDGIYDELMKRSTRFLLGESQERRLFPLLYMIDDLEKWNDLNELKKSNPNLGISVSHDYLIDEIAVAEGSLSKKSEFICKYACVKQNSSLAWLAANVVEHASGVPLDIEDFRDSYCIGGVDLSQTRDLTAACVVIEKNGELYVFSHCWLPAEKIDEATQRDGVPYNIYIQRGLMSASGDNFVDYHDCFNWFVRLVEQYQILPLQIGYDRYSAQYLVQDLNAYGFHTDDVFQGENLYGIIQETQGLLEDGRLHIGDNDLLKSHLLNSAIKMSTERGRGKLIKLSPSLHIDATAALLDAMTVRQKYYAEIGEQLKNED